MFQANDAKCDANCYSPSPVFLIVAQHGVNRAHQLTEGARRKDDMICTPSLMYVARHAARSVTALEAIGILPGYEGMSMHDGWTSYRHFQTARHALCNANHLRELTFVHEELHQARAGQLKELLRWMRDTVEQARSAGATALEPSVRNDFIARYKALLGDGLAKNPQPLPSGAPRRDRRKQSPVRNLLEVHWTYECEAHLFFNDFAVPFDNNQAKRDLRMVEVQQKVTGTYCRDTGADAAERFCSLCSTGASRVVPSLNGYNTAYWQWASWHGGPKLTVPSH